MHAAKISRGASSRGAYATPLAVVAVLLIPALLQAGEPIKVPNGSQIEQVDFERHVMGLLGRSGCNAGACHGSFQGKGGLYLSLFGYSPEKDHLAFTREGMGRRINPVNPDQSLLLLKASGQVPHGGGKRFDKDSWQYQVFRAWIAEGAKRTPGSGTVAKIEITPSQHLFKKPGEQHPLKVMAEFQDGTKADITAFTDFRVNDDYIAEVTSGGLVKGLRPGDTAVVASYRGNVLAARALVPSEVGKGIAYPKLPQVNYIDREVFAKLKLLNIVPSDLSSDSEFLRRVYIDTIGCLPTPEQTRAFLASKDPEKRAKQIDELLAHPLHAALWATKFSDITGNNVDTMEQPVNVRPKRSKMWHDWFRKRVAENMPYDQIVKGVLCATSRDGADVDDWVKDAVALDEAAAKGFDSQYAERKSLDLFWRRNQFTLEQMGEHTAAAFMGIRLECAQCHKHPFDRWTQADYRAYANIFSQVTFGSSPEAAAAIRKVNDERRKAAEGKQNRQVVQLREVFSAARQNRTLNDPDTNRTLPPRTLGGPEVDFKGDAREDLFDWLLKPENPYFARSFANRVWGHYLGVGIVDPVDNFSVANPPSNPKLLDALAEDFIKTGYDIRQLERTILNSRTYQLSAIPNSTNAQDRNNFARSYIRRMMAEVVVDVLNSALGVSEDFGRSPDVPPNCKAIEVPTNRVQNGQLAYIFRIFGRPPRSSTCDCERAAEPALPQTLFLMTDDTLIGKMQRGRLSTLLKEKQDDVEVIEELFLATLVRLPTGSEKQTALEHLDAKKDRRAALTDVLWALINTQEFVLNH
jgi:hypothetical protein